MKNDYQDYKLYRHTLIIRKNMLGTFNSSIECTLISFVQVKIILICKKTFQFYLAILYANEIQNSTSH